jgi:hypothetical protein
MDDEDDQVMETAGRHPYGALGLDDDPQVAFTGVLALRQLAEFCERYQVSRLREAGHTWSEIAGWAGVSAQALHKKHAEALKEREAHRSSRPSRAAASRTVPPNRRSGMFGLGGIRTLDRNVMGWASGSPRETATRLRRQPPYDVIASAYDDHGELPGGRGRCPPRR